MEWNGIQKVFYKKKKVSSLDGLMASSNSNGIGNSNGNNLRINDCW